MQKKLWIAGAVLILDQVTKALARTMTEAITLLPGILDLRLCHNTGMAFSLLSGMPWMLGVLSVVLVIIGWRILRRYRLGPLSGTAAMLMLGGALGNAIDRILLGSVTDMVEVLFVQFAVFNVADIALTIGCTLLALSLFIRPQEWEKRPLKEADS